ncbi:MAG: hypothetical protein ACLFU0_07575 [Alphaproteobacteria bacterium]
MGDDGTPKPAPARRGREAHADEVARAMRENLKKRKARARARAARRAEASAATRDEAE